MNPADHTPEQGWKRLVCVALMLYVGLVSACQEVDTIKRELINKFHVGSRKTKKPFTPKEGITIRACSLYQAANSNSEILRKLPADTTLHLVDQVGEWYRVKTRDGGEGYVERKAVRGSEILEKTNELRRSIEGIPPQAEGITKSDANFRLEPGRQQEVIEKLPPGKKFEVYERVVTLRSTDGTAMKNPTRGEGGPENPESDYSPVDDFGTEIKKDVWYKVKLEDGRVGYIHTVNIKLTPPEELIQAVPFMRLVAWRTLNTRDDPERGAQNNYLVAYAPKDKDAGCDFTMLYFMNWSVKLKRRNVGWKQKFAGILPITDYHHEGKPGFRVRSLHPTRKDVLVLSSFVFTGGRMIKVSEEEIPHKAELH